MTKSFEGHIRIRVAVAPRRLKSGHSLNRISELRQQITCPFESLSISVNACLKSESLPKSISLSDALSSACKYSNKHKRAFKMTLS